eukprot:scaffold82530_cov33-Tisochrysis_lutea.AAC.1
MTILDEDLGGRSSLTRWALLGRHTMRASTLHQELEANDSLKYSRVALEPVTGRSQQLRVHMASIGHPILGDVLHGGEVDAALMDELTQKTSRPVDVATKSLRVPQARPSPFGRRTSLEQSSTTDHLPRRLYLHAAVLRFRHPFTGECMKIVAPPPF